MEEPPEHEDGEVLEPTEQQTITFYGKPLRVVRLPNGEPGVVLNELCENMGLERRAQLRRIHRKRAIEVGLASVRIDTPGGPQVVSALTLKVTPAWLFGIDADRARPEMRPEIERYQAECVDVLYQWAATPRLEAPANLVPEKPIEKPTMPSPDASRELWREYYRQMTEFMDWQITIDEQMRSTEERLESIEAIIPMILEQLPPATITARHQNDVKHYVIELGKATKKHPQTIWSMVYTAFQVPTYKDLREADWDRVQHWFQAQFHKAGRPLPSEEQKRLL